MMFFTKPGRSAYRFSIVLFLTLSGFQSAYSNELLARRQFASRSLSAFCASHFILSAINSEPFPLPDTNNASGRALSIHRTLWLSTESPLQEHLGLEFLRHLVRNYYDLSARTTSDPRVRFKDTQVEKIWDQIQKKWAYANQESGRFEIEGNYRLPQDKILIVFRPQYVVKYSEGRITAIYLNDLRADIHWVGEGAVNNQSINAVLDRIRNAVRITRHASTIEYLPED